MKILDAELDSQPTPLKVANMAELRIRNLLCFKELQTFNDTGRWVGKHPLITHQSTYSRLEELYLTNHTEFLNKYHNCCHNIDRYKAYLKDPKRKDRHDADEVLLQKHTDNQAIFQSVIENNKL